MADEQNSSSLADSSRDTASNIQSIGQIVNTAVNRLSNSAEQMLHFVNETILTDYDGFVDIAVRDTGIGIPAEQLDKVKTKFFKGNATRRGSGIGLAVADEIVRMHGGELLLDSVEGEGTTVTIRLPICTQK